MKVIITGAAGCIGKQLVETLLQQSYQVFATDIKPNPFPQHAGLIYQQLDITSDEFLHWVEQVRPQGVIHLASVLQISKTLTRELAYKIDVQATENLTNLCAQIGVEKFVITTSGAAYGYHPENINSLITEDRPTKGNMDYFYSDHKAQVEQIMANAVDTYPDMKQVILRPGAIIGPNFEGPVVNLFEQRIITGLIGYPGPFNFIWSLDVVDYLVEAVTTDITGQFNVAGDGALSMRQIAKRLNKSYLPLPPLLIQAALSILKPLGIIQYGPEQVKFIKYRPVLDNSKIKQQFNHQPRYTSEQALDAYLQLSSTDVEQ
ncbi:NAD-dependent epimerase/dehydratase family protein [Psychrosphaera aquimarina]|uniref:NAD-dependent epimerase/dehydratase family protein n=1 Tax=Psychrosphaera aquimarina TaxID=2044854 RepID=A0ABU3R4R7_9GAMM|nr:NAD-dependent epimerase/dehydratase family protein [Psychrosphaera aquimarina]MDU0114667.1 NAD-dependent epimerase/dehydratase family protein [Psychrosphaera aquimarina]